MQSDAIRYNQMQSDANRAMIYNQIKSDAFRGKQRQSEIDDLPIGKPSSDAIRESDEIRYNQMQSDAIKCNQMQSDAIRYNQMHSDAFRGKQRQAEASSGNHLLLGEQAIGQCDEIVLFRAQSALVPPDAPGHRCRALRRASAIRCGAL
jgi:hypothetical protein